MSKNRKKNCENNRKTVKNVKKLGINHQKFRKTAKNDEKPVKRRQK